MGSINLCPKTPDSLQKELAQSEYSALRKRPKCVKIMGLTPLGGSLKIFSDEKQIFSNIPLYIGHHIRYLLK